MTRSLSLTLILTLAALSAANGQGITIRACADANAQSLVNREAALDKRLDNELKAVKTYFAKRVANIKGRTEVKLTAMQENQRLLAATIEYQQAYGKLRQEERERRQNQRSELAARERLRQQSQLVHVDISTHLRWPEALQQPELASSRQQLQDALRSDRRLVSLNAAADLEQIRELAASMFAAVRAQRDELGDRRVIEAKRYLDGLLRAAEQAAAPPEPAQVASVD